MNRAERPYELVSGQGDNVFYPVVSSEQTIMVVSGVDTQGPPKVPWQKRWLTYDWIIIIITIIFAIVAFISSLINAWPHLIKMSGNLVAIAFAAESAPISKSSGNYADIKDLIISGGIMLLCLSSAAVCFCSSTKEKRAKHAQDLVKLTLGFLVGRHTR